MIGHIIVCGDDPLGLRITGQLRAAGRTIAVIERSAELTDAGIASATAVICADDDDALNLEIAVLARQFNPDVRVVARLGIRVATANWRPGTPPIWWVRTAKCWRPCTRASA